MTGIYIFPRVFFRVGAVRQGWSRVVGVQVEEPFALYTDEVKR